MRIAVADPPYPLTSQRLYGQHPDFAGEVDHAELLRELQTYDAWALFTSASMLQHVLALAPRPQIDGLRVVSRTGTRVLVWIKPQPIPRPVDVQWCWEAILIGGGRSRRGRPVLRDAIVANPRDGNEFPGAKPYVVCRYVFDALGAEAEDELVDLFPGSGAVSAAWDAWARQGSLL